MHNIVDAVLHCNRNGMEAYQGGTCNEAGISARTCIPPALATSDAHAGQPKRGLRRRDEHRLLRDASHFACSIPGKARRRPAFKILSPRFSATVFPTSFRAGGESRPHLVDAGSTDPGPYYLGAGKAFTGRTGVKRDLRYMPPTAVFAAGIPSSSARPAASRCPRLIRLVAQGHSRNRARGRAQLHLCRDSDRCRQGHHSPALDAGAIEPLDLVPPLTHAAIDASPNIVAQRRPGVHAHLLEAGAQVVLAGRAHHDPACFAALPILRGYDEGLALHCGKILECAAIAATPGSGSDCAMGILYDDRFVLKRCPTNASSAESAAAHAVRKIRPLSSLPGPGRRARPHRLHLHGTQRRAGEVRGSRQCAYAIR